MPDFSFYWFAIGDGKAYSLFISKTENGIVRHLNFQTACMLNDDWCGGFMMDGVYGVGFRSDLTLMTGDWKHFMDATKNSVGIYEMDADGRTRYVDEFEAKELGLKDECPCGPDDWNWPRPEMTMAD